MTTVQDRALNFWCNVMLAGIGLIILLSAFMILPPLPAISYFNFILFGHPTFPETMSDDGISYVTFTYGLLGCIMIGWMVPLIYLTNSLLRQGSAVALNVISLSLGIWFVTDSSLSIILGYWQNAVSNVSLGIIFLVALLKIRSQIIDHTSEGQQSA